MVFQLEPDELWFPDASLAEEDGLLAVGGDLSEERLLLAYQHGIFPWYSNEMPILWYAPHERFVLFPDELKISKSMRRLMRSGDFRITVNTAFNRVIAACAASKRKEQDGTWITTDMETAYIRLHQAGYAHAVEVWQGKALAGGLYGVVVNRVFCGESMFSKVSNASKLALVYLCEYMNFIAVDCQVHTPHLESMGARFVSRADYLKLLGK